VSLTGSGTVTLSNSGSGSPGPLIAQAVSGSPLTNVDNTNQRFGQIGGSSGFVLVNQGTVDANVSPQMLALNAGGAPAPLVIGHNEWTTLSYFQWSSTTSASCS
jgi:hypothetical protein